MLTEKQLQLIHEKDDFTSHFIGELFGFENVNDIINEIDECFYELIDGKLTVCTFCFLEIVHYLDSDACHQIINHWLSIKIN